MKDIVIVPTYFRPEYLQLCLEYLTKAEGIESKQIWIMHDHHEYDERTHAIEEQWNQEIIGEWRHYRGLDIQFKRGLKHSTHGNSRNVLEAYKAAFNTGANMIYLIEDDVFVTPDFFRWHEAVQADGDYFCSVGYNCKFKWPATFTPVSESDAYYTAHYYGSYGVGWKRQNLELIIPHAKNEYYTDMDNYVKNYLPGTRLGDRYTEQDGLIERVMLKQHRPVAFPVQSRAFHMGFYGYHRKGQRPNGFLGDKLKGLRKMVADPATFQSSVNNPYNDLLPYAESGAWTSLRKVASI